MKTTILKTIIITFIIAIGMTSCNNTTKQKEENLENAQENLVIAEQELEQAVIDSTNEYIRYKKEIQEKLTANELKIAEMKANLKAEKAEIRLKYEQQLTEIEKRNQDLKISLADYKENDITKWEKFKESFNRDLDTIGAVISRISLNK